MKTAHIVHGFNVTDRGKATTDKMITPLEEQGYEIREWDYGWKFLLGTWYTNPRIARQIAREVRQGDIGVGHSNGCAILYRASQMASFGGMVFINPALDKDKAPDCKWFHIYHNAGDTPVKMSKYIPGVYWGEMGRTGYIGGHPHTNYDGQSTLGLSYLDGHSVFFEHNEWIRFAALNAAGEDF